MFSTLAKSFVLVGALASLVPAAASAGEVQNRINRQQQRVQNGVQNGQLTHREYDHVEARDQRIENARNRDLSRNGGYLTGRERYNLNRRLNGDSRNIYFDKHDRARQPGAPLR